MSPLPTAAAQAALLLFEHTDGRRLVALAGNTIVAGDPAWHRAGPVELDPALTPPRIGEPWPEQGGVYLGLVRGQDGKPDYHLIRAAAQPDKLLTWKQALAWAASVRDGGFSDWTLPSRGPEGWVMCAAGGVEKSWHWLAEQEGSYAWHQYFLYGFQDYDRKSFEGCARAVRRLALQSFSSLTRAAA